MIYDDSKKENALTHGFHASISSSCDPFSDFDPKASDLTHTHPQTRLVQLLHTTWCWLKIGHPTAARRYLLSRLRDLPSPWSSRRPASGSCRNLSETFSSSARAKAIEIGKPGALGFGLDTTKSIPSDIPEGRQTRFRTSPARSRVHDLI
jgi:hypothetical protein